MEKLNPQKGVYLFGKDSYLIKKDEKGVLRVYNPNGIILANPELFRFEDPITIEEIMQTNPPKEVLDNLEKLMLQDLRLTKHKFISDILNGPWGPL